MFEVIADQNRPIALFSMQNGKPEIFSKMRESPRVLRDLAFSLSLHLGNFLIHLYRHRYSAMTTNSKLHIADVWKWDLKNIYSSSIG